MLSCHSQATSSQLTQPLHRNITFNLPRCGASATQPGRTSSRGLPHPAWTGSRPKHWSSCTTLARSLALSRQASIGPTHTTARTREKTPTTVQWPGRQPCPCKFTQTRGCNHHETTVCTEVSGCHTAFMVGRLVPATRSSIWLATL